jgi:NAD(P)-dependent dehydrogenase (short-subunit alcohol dehydrogenase family)
MARIAIITGGASDIGRVLASALVAWSDTVVVADVDGNGAERAAIPPRTCRIEVHCA